MKFINEIREDEHVVEHYLCKEKQSLKSKTGKTYYSLKLQDKTGTVNAKVWELNKDIQSFEQNDYIKIDAVALTYQNEIQLKVSKIRRSSEGEYDPKEYIPSTDKDIPVMYDKLMEIINTISDNNLKKLVKSVLEDDETIKNNIKTHSAAKSMHHGYLGGLIEHILSVTQTCDFLSTRYKYVNRDLLISGAVMHDIGKIFELSPFPENDYTDEGQLLGHIIIGIELCTKYSQKIENFPKDTLNVLKHLILSHHGELEYGSPKKPATIEAFILHVSDNLDAKIKMYEEAIANDVTNGKWVGYNKMLATNIRKANNE